MKGMCRIATLAVGLLLGARAEARVEFVLQTGVGFDDPTVVAPVGENPGTTLGQQRRLMMERALAIWSDKLESSVPIVVLAEFDELSCNDKGAVVGGASPTGWIGQRRDDGLPSLIYPMALGDKLAGRNVVPDRPDIYIVFNSAIDTRPCRDRLGGLYYGFDGASGAKIDLLSTALHELAHGFGFSSTIDEVTGVQQVSLGIDIFSAHVRDLDLDATWDELTASERARSGGNVRRLVFDGEATKRASAHYLDRGEPTLSFEPKVAGFSGFVADVGFALDPSQHPVTGPLMLADPIDGCGDFRSSVAGAVLVIEPNPVRCRGRDALLRAQRGGAAAILLVTPSPVDRPALPLAAGPVVIDLPIVTVGASDAVSMARAISRRKVQATLGGDPARRIGADAEGHPFLFASYPSLPGSSISHFDPIARPDLLMEPYTSEVPTHDLDLTVAVMRDLGWITACGNGVVEAGEECDDGPRNEDVPGAACRTTCRRPFCGDAVIDANEVCDEGEDNSNGRANACRVGCYYPFCGDGVLDQGEECDSTPRCSAECGVM